MAKAAPKKKASSAHRKVQASTVRNRKDVKRKSTTTASQAVKEQKDQKSQAPKGQKDAKSQVAKSQKNQKSQAPKEPTSQKKAKKIVVEEKTEQVTEQKVEQVAEQKVEQVAEKKAEQPKKKTIRVEEKTESEITNVAANEAPSVSPQTEVKETATEKTAEPAPTEKAAEPETKPEEPAESKIILHGDKRMHPQAQEIVRTVEETVPQHKTYELKTDEKNVEEIIQEVVERQNEIAQQMAAQSVAAESAEPEQSATAPETSAATTEMPVAPAAARPVKQDVAPRQRLTAKQQKEAAIQKAIAETKAAPMPQRKRSRERVHFGFRRVVLAMACAAAAVFAIVYFVHQSTPNISLKVAAMQSGIDARYPNYVPRDFSLSDITSENGKITLNFRNSETSEAFTLVEEKSAWDSNALFTNYVKSNYDDDYTQVSEQGLTIYISGNNACWVNGGVVYKLKTTAGSLTKKQIKAIAVSL